MATIPYTIVKTANSFVYLIKWLALDKDDVGQSFALATVQGAGGSDRSIQVLGTFGTSSAVFQGSNDLGTTWVTLTDPQGNPISKTVASIEEVLEYTYAVRPTVTGGTSASVDFYLVVRGSR